MSFFIGLILFSWIDVWAQELQIPALTSPVMDEAGLLTPAERQDLSSLAYEIYANKGPQITVLTVKDLQDYPIEEFSIRVAEQWKLGLKEKGNGLLIIISQKDRKVRLEVGEGIEGEITDYDANAYIRRVITPAFKQGAFHQGLKTVMVDIARKFNIAAEATGPPVMRRSSRQVNSKFANLFPFAILLMGIIHLFLRRKRVARGVASGAGLAGLGFLAVPGLGLGAIMLFFFGLVLGLVGINNILFALAMSRGGRMGGGFGGGGFGGGGGWGGGGGGFSGGGSSGSW